MNIFGKTLILLFLAAVMLVSCTGVQSTPTMGQADFMETAMATVSTGLAETQRAIPTNTPLPTFSLPTITLTPTATQTVAPSPTTTPIFPPIESFVGRWLNTDSNSEGWSRILIANNEGTLSAHWQIVCTLTEEEMLWHYPDELICGEDRFLARYSGNPVRTSIDTKSSTINYTFSLNGDMLHVTTFIDLTDNSSRADKTLEADFRKLVPSFPVSEEIVFYHFVVGPLFHRRVPRGSVRTEGSSDMGPVYLFPASSDEPRTSNTATDLRTAFELALQHEENLWINSDLKIVDVTFRNGHAEVVLQGEYVGESEALLNAVRMQILLTVFSNPDVQTAAVTLNGDTIGNLGISSSTNAKPADYVYTRTEMETYLIEHAFIDWP